MKDIGQQQDFEQGLDMEQKSETEQKLDIALSELTLINN